MSKGLAMAQSGSFAALGVPPLGDALIADAAGSHAASLIVKDDQADSALAAVAVSPAVGAAAVQEPLWIWTLTADKQTASTPNWCILGNCG